MRHGHRQDEEDAYWHQTASRPWDPPLSAKGKQQAAEVASKVSELGVQLLVSSPFRRCLQTSAELVRELGLKQGQWLVDWQLAEICEPRVLFSDRGDARARVQQASISSWMWAGLSLPAALEQFISQDCKLSRVPIQPQPRPSQPPHYPESLGDGLQRYHAALQELARSFPGQTVLVVTHGECVRSAVTTAEPHSEVFEVKHTGHVVLEQQQQQQQPGKASATVWRLDCEAGETGVLWLEDD